MFSIGSEKWPGISKLIEEAAEVTQVCGKLLGTNGEVEHWEGSNLKERLEQEISDLSAAIFFVVKYCKLDWDKIKARTTSRLSDYERWHFEDPKTLEERRIAGISDRKEK